MGRTRGNDVLDSGWEYSSEPPLPTAGLASPSFPPSGPSRLRIQPPLNGLLDLRQPVVGLRFAARLGCRHLPWTASLQQFWLPTSSDIRPSWMPTKPARMSG